jgi:hypothetical protein
VEQRNRQDTMTRTKVSNRILRRNLNVSSSVLTLSFSIPTDKCSGDHTAYVSGYKKMEDPSYFTEDYYGKFQFSVRTCAHCERRLDSKAMPVYACNLAANTKLPCMHAFCAPCYDKKESLEPPNKRNRRQPKSKEIIS